MREASENNLMQVAQILKSNGTDGELLVSFRDMDPEDLDTQEPVFIFFDGLPVPFYFESFAKRGSSRALVRLTGIHNLEDAEEVTGQAVYVSRDAYSQEGDPDEMDFEALVGWTVLTEDGSRVGEITGYEDIPGNPCIYVLPEGSEEEAMLPLHQDLIHGLDPDAGTIVMTVPEGLF